MTVVVIVHIMKNVDSRKENFYERESNKTSYSGCGGYEY